jgi:hypothetical protein
MVVQVIILQDQQKQVVEVEQVQLEIMAQAVQEILYHNMVLVEQVLQVVLQVHQWLTLAVEQVQLTMVPHLVQEEMPLLQVELEAVVMVLFNLAVQQMEQLTLAVEEEVEVRVVVKMLVEMVEVE